MNYTIPFPPFGTNSQSCGGCPCDTGYSPTDPRAYKPTAQNAFVGMNSPVIVNNNVAIPLSTVFNSSGTHISGTNPINLTAGHKYLVEFTVIGKPALAADQMGAKLQLNGSDVNGSAAAAQSVAGFQSVSGGAIVTVLNNPSQLTLVGLSVTNATFNYASVRIVEVE